MSYIFDFVGVSPILSFFNYQQQLEYNQNRSKAYLGSYKCTLDAFIESMEMIPQKPNWDWNRVIDTIIDFWLSHEDSVGYWRSELKAAGRENLLIGRVANLNELRTELESLF